MYYLVGSNELETACRLIKINRTILMPRQLAEIVREDPLIYSPGEIADVLDMIHEGNKTTGGLVKIATAVGIVGFVKFLNGYYLTLITQRKEVGCIAGNYIYTIKATEMFPIRPRPPPESNKLKSFWKSLNKRISQTASEIAESRYLGLFQFIDMTKDFFFSYSYDLTHSLQYNYIAAKNGNVPPSLEMFEWNHYQIHGPCPPPSPPSVCLCLPIATEFRTVLGEISASQWSMPIVHGSYQQKRFSQLGSTMDLILMARRSRHYAGTRYLKRGLNVSGKVANDCEVEQILQYDEGADLKFCSYVQMRGSIPTYWHQETSVTMPKPPILINRVDPDYLATQEHFSDMFRRYGSPIIVLDLVKQHERRPRESLVGREFRISIETLNDCVAMRHKVRYVALDYSKITSISKGKFTKAKGHKSGFFKKGGDDKERATAAIGDEWNLMEKSLVKSASTADTPVKGKMEVQTLTKFDDNKKTPSFNMSSPVNLSNQPTGKTAFDAIDDVSAVESRIDVLKELEDIASLGIQETGFFCNTLQFSDRMQHILTVPTVKKAEASNMLIQSGVLRTNCVDCLDRTNGGQFAVGLYFLRIALYSLGLRNRYSKNIEIHKDPMLLMLMEMYGEMADKIALQYGGSEAHKKVLAGKTVAANNSKQNELLTSIKRYYSNAFTDMVKQDAMNIFLGCFVPAESSIPLWDLESDYHLHNISLHPPRPKIYRILYNEIALDSLRLKDGVLRVKIDSMIKKIIQKMITMTVANSQDQLVNADKRAESPALDDELVIEGVKLTSLDCAILLRRYYMRFVGQTPSLPTTANVAGGENQPVRAASPLPVGNSVSSKRRKNAYASTINSLTRLERRRLMRCIMATKIAESAQSWWQEAIREYNLAHTIHDFTVKDQEDLLLGTAALGKLVDNNIYSSANPEDLLPASSYYERFYRPQELTDFDSLLAMDFFAVTEISHNSIQSTKGPADGEANPSPVTDLSILSNILYYPNLLTSAVVGHGQPQGGEEDEEIAEAVAELAQIKHSMVLNPNNPQIASKDEDDDDEPGTPAVFTLGRYVREIGQKARNMIGFLRKDDTNGQTANIKRTDSNLGNSPKYLNNSSAITSLHSNIPKVSEHLYTSYAAVDLDNTILLYDAQPSIYDTQAIREEYTALLREQNIHVDDVFNMEQLARDAHVSREISRGIFAGLNQHYSANLAHLFLLLSVEFMNNELLSFGNFIDTQYNISNVKPKATDGMTSHARVFHPPHSSGSPTTIPVDSAYSTNNLNNLDFSKRRDMIAKTLSMEITSKLQERVKTCMQQQNAMHFSNFRNHFVPVPGNSGAANTGEIVAQGLENELRKIVNNHIFQQYTYSKEISLDRLALRISSLSNEVNLMTYLNQFDYDVLASDFANMLYILKDSTQFGSGYKEVFYLQRKLDSAIKLIQAKKAAFLAPPPAVTPVRAPSPKKEVDAEEKMNRRKSYRQTRKDQMSKEIENRRARTAPIVPTRTGSVYSTKYGTVAAQDGVKSISTQLGIYNAILEDDLRTDFSLNLYNSYSSASDAMDKEQSCPSYPFAAFPYNQDNYRIADHDYLGFVQLAPDLYSRATNPHLQLNEVGVMRFQESLKRQEMAMLDDIATF